MTERSRAILGAVVILACFALLGYMVHIKAEGAVVAAIATVTVVVAWVTRTPPKDPKDPPQTGVNAVVVAAGAIAASLMATSCLSASEKSVLAESSYREQQRACIRQYAPDDALITACRKKVQSEWGIVEVVAKDGGP